MIKSQKRNKFEKTSYFWSYLEALVVLVIIVLIVNTAFNIWLPNGHHKQIERMTKEIIELKAENNKQFLQLVELRKETAEIDNESRVFKQVIAEVVKKCN